MSNNIAYCSLLVLLLQSCVVIHGRGGKTWLYRKSISIGRPYSTDTTNVTIRPFDAGDYNSKEHRQLGKQVFMQLQPNDLMQVAQTNSIDYVVFYKPGCSGDRETIRDFDTLARKGKRIMAVARALDTKRNRHMLAGTTFTDYPIVFIDGKSLPKDAALRLIAFIRIACPACYDTYKDDLIDTYCLSLKNGKIEVMMYSKRSQL